MAPPSCRVTWRNAFRAIPSIYPPIDLFERLYDDPAELELTARIEGLTNDRLRHEAGDLTLVPPNERVLGPGASPVMAAFTHIGVASRFTDGSFGVYYCAKEFETAVAESSYHRARFLAATSEPAIDVQMRTYICRIDGRFHDLREGFAEVYQPNPNRYWEAQQLASRLRAAGSSGVCYRSVRREGGECLGVFRPTAISPYQDSSFTVQGAHFVLHWNGKTITRYSVVAT